MNTRSRFLEGETQWWVRTRLPSTAAPTGHQGYCILECMFEMWSDRRTVRQFDPPRPVVIDMTILDPACGRPYGFAPGGVSLRVRAFGARIEARMPAQQLAWLQLSSGLWRGICQMRIESVNHVSSVAVMLWVPPEAIRVEREASDEAQEH